MDYEYENDFFSDEDEQGDPGAELQAMVEEEIQSTRQRLKEIQSQVDSTRTAVNREQENYTTVVSELSAIKANLDTTPREDIRDRYEDALKISFRLSTMRGQLEKLEATYQNFEQKQILLSQMLGKLQGVEVLGDGTEVLDTGGVDVIGIIRAQEDERKRLARSLHDGPAQSLTNFILQAEICQRLFDRNPERAADELINLKSSASSTFQKVREFIFDLSPMMLEDLGVIPTVRRYIESYSEKNDIEVNFEIRGDERRLENYREVMIFRGAQDLMGMARDYGAPTKVEVMLNLSSEPIQMMVEDNGRGFRSDYIFEPDYEDTIHDARVEALRMLKSRFELAGGKIEVRSDENDGTVVRADMPSGE
ncbi:MAG: histidine kinase [Aggregatilineales bacterium]